MMDDSDCYKEGSEACRNYSRLTMQVRTLSQQVLLGSGLALAIFFATQPTEKVGPILVCAGMSMVMFSVGLMYVGCHFQMAFEAVRDSLAELELSNGPWSYHKKAREGEADVNATYLPLKIPGIVGTLVTTLGAWFLCDEIGFDTRSWPRLVVVSAGIILPLVILYVPSRSLICAHNCAAEKRRPKEPPVAQYLFHYGRD